MHIFAYPSIEQCAPGKEFSSRSTKKMEHKPSYTSHSHMHMYYMHPYTQYYIVCRARIIIVNRQAPAELGRAIAHARWLDSAMLVGHLRFSGDSRSLTFWPMHFPRSARSRNDRAHRAERTHTHTPAALRAIAISGLRAQSIYKPELGRSREKPLQQYILYIHSTYDHHYLDGVRMKTYAAPLRYQNTRHEYIYESTRA